MVEDRPRVLLVGRCLIKNEADKILLIKRAAEDSWEPNKWEFPGGKVDTGQEVTKAAEREVFEETELTVKVNSPVCYFESGMAKGEKYVGMPLILLVEMAVLVSGEVKLSREHQDFTWCTKKEALELELSQETKKALIALIN